GIAPAGGCPRRSPPGRGRSDPRAAAAGSRPGPGPRERASSPRPAWTGARRRRGRRRTGGDASIEPIVPARSGFLSAWSGGRGAARAIHFAMNPRRPNVRVFLAAMVVLMAVPVAAGIHRLVQLATGAPTAPDDVRFFAAPIP